MHTHPSESKGCTLATAAIRLSAFGEFCSNFATNSGLYAQLLDNLFASDESFLGFPKDPLIVSAVLSVFIAAGAAYAHKNFNEKHQDIENKLQVDPDLKEKLLHKTTDHEFTDLLDPELQPGQPVTEEGSIQNPPEEETQELTLHPLEEILLFFDWLAHAGEFAAPITLAHDIATHSSNLPQWSKTLVQTLTFFLGILGGYANYRTCRNSMKGKKEDPNSEPDVWSKISFWTETLGNLISNTAWTAELLASFFNEEMMDKSAVETRDYLGWQFWASLALGIPTAIAAARIHYFVNIRHGKGGTNVNELKNTSETPAQTKDSTQFIKELLLKAGDAYTHIGDRASCLSFILKITTRDQPLSKTNGMLLQSIAALFGAATSAADLQTCWSELRAFQEEQNKHKNVP